ncbi:MAG: hypothetical protein HRU46_13955 [Verrucomicrobiales bacterium]|nr:hypothetical protein [Verrucomicrobiales bacterium]
MKTRWSLLFLVPLLCTLLASCSPATNVEGDNQSGTIYGGQPTSQIERTIQMQDAFNQVNRALSPGF